MNKIKKNTVNMQRYKTKERKQKRLVFEEPHIFIVHRFVNPNTQPCAVGTGVTDTNLL